MRNIFLLFLILAGLSGSLSVEALQIADYPGFLNLRAGMPLTELVGSIFNFLLMIAGLAAFIMVVWGGVKYLSSAGDPSKTRDAKNQIFAAILGMIILFSSWMILHTINPDLINIREPGVIPPPQVTPPTVPIPPKEGLPAAFIYIPLGQIIDDVLLQENEAIREMKNFAAAAELCGVDYCDGGECEYYVSVPCPEEGEDWGDGEEGGDGDTGGDTGGDWDWGGWDWFWMLKPIIAYAQGDCGYWATCSAPCNTGDPCPSNRESGISEVLAAAGEMESEMDKLKEAKSKISNCVLDEENLLLSCQEVLDIFRPSEGEDPVSQWDEIKDCNQAYDFYCLAGLENDAYLEEISFPFETIEKSVEATRNLEGIISSCSCSSASFCCECCNACSGTPCSSETYEASGLAVGAVNELEARASILEETITEISLYSIADEITTLTCSEAYSWLRSIKGSGCPGTDIFPCCPIDAEMEETIRNCKAADFFFCIAP